MAQEFFWVLWSIGLWDASPGNATVQIRFDHDVGIGVLGGLGGLVVGFDFQ